MRTRSVISWLVSLAMIGAGLTLVALFFLSQGGQSTATNESDPKGFNVPKIEPTREKARAAGGPEDKTLKRLV